ncbi:MAG: carboxypeptidase-like regulatory domain-containing protein [Firmicutes bacterium]|nr:carboxypeptidase-like regulatory domain-containing protein [Bacillota bacterium]
MKKILIVPILLLCIGIFSGFGGGGQQITPFGGPAIHIYDFVDFVRIGRNPAFPADGHFVLMNDIQFPCPWSPQPSGSDIDDLLDYIPDYFTGNQGFRGVQFWGTFDGQGYIISGIAGARQREGNRYESSSGLFSTLGRNDADGGALVATATVKDLTVEFGLYRSANYRHDYGGMGGIAGIMRAGTIQNVHVVIPSGVRLEAGYYSNRIGGLVGRMYYNSQIIDSTVEGEIFIMRGRYHSIGGLVGYMSHYASIENSHAIVTITQNPFVYTHYTNTNNGRYLYRNNNPLIPNRGVRIGGLVGFMVRYTTIANSTANFTIHQVGYRSAVGGLVGYLGYGYRTAVDNSTAIGTLNARGAAWVGGFVGRTFGASVINNSVADVDIVGREIAWYRPTFRRNTNFFGQPTGNYVVNYHRRWNFSAVGGFVGAIRYNVQILNSESKGSLCAQFHYIEDGHDVHSRYHYMGVGGFVGMMHGPWHDTPRSINNRTETMVNMLQHRQGLVGVAADRFARPMHGGFAGMVRDSALIRNSHAGGEMFVRQSERQIGGFVGYLRNDAQILNSSADVTIRHYMPTAGEFSQAAGFVGRMGWNARIENFISGGQILTDDPTMRGTAAFGSRIYDGVITNGFVYTDQQTLNSILFGIDRANIDRSSVFFNTEILGLSTHPSAQGITSDTMRSENFVYNILNRAGMSIFMENSDPNGFPLINPNPAAFAATNVTVDGLTPATGFIESIDGISGQRLQSLRLVPGVYNLGVMFRNIRYTYTITVLAGETDQGLVLVTFNTHMGSAITTWLVSEGFSLATVGSTEIGWTDAPEGMTMMGWFNRRLHRPEIGLPSIEVHNVMQTMNVYARFEAHGISGQVNVRADVSIYATTGERLAHFYSVNYIFQFVNISGGTYEIVFAHDGFVTQSKTIIVSDGELALAPVVLLPTLLVVETSIGSTVYLTSATTAPRSVVPVNQGGNLVFTFIGVLEGEYTLRFEGSGVQTATMDIVFGREHMSVMSPPLVLVTISGTALVGSQMVLLANMQEQGTFTVGVDGTFIFHRVPNQIYQLVVSLNGFNTETFDIAVSGGNSEVVDATLANPTIISGTTRAGATVSLIKEGEIISVQEADSQGNFIFSDILNGYYTLQFERQRFITNTMSISIVAASQEIQGFINLERERSSWTILGYILQGLLVLGIVVVVWFILYRREKKAL